MSKKFKVGDRVQVIDSSYGVRVDSYENFSYLDKGRKYEVVGFTEYSTLYNYTKSYVVHDVYIKDTRSGRLYLHSQAFLKVVEPEVKELTVADVERHFGCKVKIVK